VELYTYESQAAEAAAEAFKYLEEWRKSLQTQR